MSGGALSYMVEENVGHADKIFDGIERLHASMKARGASASAIARLPKLPTKMKPLDAGLPPILLATRPHRLSPTSAFVPHVQRTPRPRNSAAEAYKRELRQNLKERLSDIGRKITDRLSASSGLSEYMLLGPGNGEYPAKVRALGMMAAIENGASTKEAAAIMGRERTAVTHARNKLPIWLEQDEKLRRIKAELDAALGAK